MLIRKVGFKSFIDYLADKEVKIQSLLVAGDGDEKRNAVWDFIQARKMTTDDKFLFFGDKSKHNDALLTICDTAAIGYIGDYYCVDDIVGWVLRNYLAYYAAPPRVLFIDQDQNNNYPYTRSHTLLDVLSDAICAGRNKGKQRLWIIIDNDNLAKYISPWFLATFRNCNASIIVINDSTETLSSIENCLFNNFQHYLIGKTGTCSKDWLSLTDLRFFNQEKFAVYIKNLPARNFIYHASSFVLNEKKAIEHFGENSNTYIELTPCTEEDARSSNKQDDLAPETANDKPDESIGNDELLVAFEPLIDLISKHGLKI